jgi:hypothetical protein
MEIHNPYRPAVSRETRLLLAAGILAVASLWLLARIRFPERPVTPNPVPAVLSQLGTSPKYDDLAGEIWQLQTRLQPALVALERAAALRLRDDLAVTLVPAGTNRELWNSKATVLARDAASGIAVVRLARPVPTPSSPAAPWTSRQLPQSRYLFASVTSPEGVSVRPVFVGSFHPLDSPLWSEPLWMVPERTDLEAGAFLFTTSAELAGLVMSLGGRLVIVPGAIVLAEAERLLTRPPGPAGVMGVEVQDLTPPLAAVTGVAAGVVVAWVDPSSAISRQLSTGDVIEAIDGRTVTGRQYWNVRAARLAVGETLTLRVRHLGEVRDVVVVAGAPPPPADRSLGLTLRARRDGAEIVAVAPGSAAHQAGLNAGDVITLVAATSAPTPAQVVRSFAAIDAGRRLMVAVTRGDAHFVTTLLR